MQRNGNCKNQSVQVDCVLYNLISEKKKMIPYVYVEVQILQQVEKMTP